MLRGASPVRGCFDRLLTVEFLRDTGTAVCFRVDDLLDQEPAICDPVRMEVLAGACSERHLQELRGLLARATMLPTTAGNYEEAAALHRACRLRGETARRLIDCLIASVAIGAGIAVLHADADFDALHASRSFRSSRPGAPGAPGRATTLTSCQRVTSRPAARSHRRRRWARST